MRKGNEGLTPHPDFIQIKITIWFAIALKAHELPLSTSCITPHSIERRNYVQTVHRSEY